ncbi:hypothetical protein OF83DRAFT_1083714 [Amylostereum chailletii]|nr:hypothetical protein OF83DRAFT_1083714 [Amylostereum chailletii]
MASLLEGLFGPFLLETALWGLFFPLLVLAVWILVVDKGLTARADTCMLVAIAVMYIASSVHWTMNLIFIRAQVSPHRILTTKTWNSIQAAMLAVNFVVGDAIVIWRACLLWEENIFVIVALGTLLLSTLSLSIANIAMIRPDIPAVSTELRFTSGHVGAAAIALSLASNVGATGLVAFKAWYASSHNPFATCNLTGLYARQEIEKPAEDVLAAGKSADTAREGHVAFGGVGSDLQLPTSFIISNVSDALGAFGPFIAEGMGQLTGIYPTIIIVLVCFQKTNFQRQFKSTSPSTPAPAPTPRTAEKRSPGHTPAGSWEQYNVPLSSLHGRASPDLEAVPMMSTNVGRPAAAPCFLRAEGMSFPSSLLSFCFLAISLVLHISIRKHVLRISLPRITFSPPTLSFPKVYINVPSRTPSPGPSFSPAPAAITITSTLSIALITRPTLSLSLSLSNLTFSTPLAIHTAPHIHIRLPVSLARRAKATFHALQIRIFSSACVPMYIKVVREAIVKTVVLGSIERAGGARLDVVLGEVVSDGTRQDRDQGGVEVEGGGDDDILLMHTAENLVMHDRLDRLYTFRAVSACMRRTWGGPLPEDDGGIGGSGESWEGRGGFEMEVDDAWWVRCDGGAAEKHLTAENLLGGDDVNDDAGDFEVQETLSWYSVWRDPFSMLDLHFLKATVSFDAFRMRDAELVRWGFEGIARGVGLAVGSSRDYGICRRCDMSLRMMGPIEAFDSWFIDWGFVGGLRRSMYPHNPLSKFAPEEAHCTWTRQCNECYGTKNGKETSQWTCMTFAWASSGLSPPHTGTSIPASLSACFSHGRQAFGRLLNLWVIESVVGSRRFPLSQVSSVPLMQPDDARTLAISLLQEKIPTLVLETAFFGVFTLLILFCVRVLACDFRRYLKRGFKSKVTMALGLATSVMYLSSTLHWILSLYMVLTIADDPQKYALTSAGERPDAYPRAMALQMSMALNFLISDGIVLWRACVIWNSNKFVVAYSVALIVASIVTGSVDLAFFKAPPPDTPVIGNQLAFVLEGSGIASLILSLVANFSATTLVGWKAWKHRQSLRKMGRGKGSRTIVGKVLMLLVESGVFYCCLWALFVITGPISIYNALGLFSVLLHAGMPQFTIPVVLVGLEQGIYPTVIIVIVCSHNMPNNVDHALSTFDARAGNPSALHPTYSSAGTDEAWIGVLDEEGAHNVPGHIASVHVVPNLPNPDGSYDAFEKSCINADEQRGDGEWILVGLPSG